MMGDKEPELAHKFLPYPEISAKPSCSMKNIEPPFRWQQILERDTPGIAFPRRSPDTKPYASSGCRMIKSGHVESSHRMVLSERASVDGLREHGPADHRPGPV